MNDRLNKLLNAEMPSSVPPREADRARPNADLLTKSRGDVANSRSFREAKRADEEAAASKFQADPEDAAIADVNDMMRVIEEEMAKLLPPANVKADWDKQVEAGKFRTWMLPTHKAARFPIGAHVGSTPVKIFRMHVRAAVIGLDGQNAGGTLQNIIQSAQFTGRWEPYEFAYRQALIGGGTTVNVETGQIVAHGAGAQNLLLHVMFVDVAGADPVRYDAKGMPSTEPQVGELAAVLREFRERNSKQDAEAKDSQIADLRRMVEELTAKVNGAEAAEAGKRQPTPKQLEYYNRNKDGGGT